MFRKLWYHIRNRLREPVLVDRRIDVCASISWLLLGLWGIFASISDYTTVAEASGPDYNFLWGLSIGILGLISAIAAVSTTIGTNIHHAVYKKTTELISISLLAGLISVFPLLRLIDLFSEKFSTDSVAGAALACFFMVFPTWRIFHLTERIRGLRKIDNI